MTQVKTILGKTGFSLKGDWKPGSYDRLSLVSYLGSSFVSLENDNTALLTDATKWMVIASKGDKGDQGYTVQLKIGTIQSGDQPSVSFTDAGIDDQGNPIKAVNFVLKKGDIGHTPIIEIGTVTTIDPTTKATIELVNNGLSDDGIQKYLLNASIPRGETGLPGKGAGNVYAIGDSLVVGKKYLFMPASTGSTEGTFIEYVPPTIPEHPSFPAHLSGLYKITVNNQGHVTDVTAVTKADITALGIPAQDTNTVYSHPGFTARSAGLYKITVNNQGHVTDVTAVTKADITALGIPAQDTNTIYSHPAFAARTAGLYKITVNDQGHVTAVATVTKADITALGIPAQDTNTTYVPATESTNGLMTAADKQRLNKAVVPSDIVVVSSLSGMPVDKYNIKFTYNSASAQAISFTSKPPEGFECIVSILNSTSTNIVQPLPNAAPWQTEDTSVELPSSKVTEISIRYVHGKYVIRV